MHNDEQLFNEFTEKIKKKFKIQHIVYSEKFQINIFLKYLYLIRFNIKKILLKISYSNLRIPLLKNKRINKWRHYYDLRAIQYKYSYKAVDRINYDNLNYEKKYIKHFITENNPDSEGLCIDLCCGNGKFSECFINKPVSFDISFEMCRLVKSSSFPVQGDCKNLPFKNNTIKNIICIGAIHLIPDYKKVISEIIRILKHGGTAVIQTINPESVIRKIMNLFFDFNFNYINLNKMVRHCSKKNIETEIIYDFYPLKYYVKTNTIKKNFNYSATTYCIILKKNEL